MRAIMNIPIFLGVLLAGVAVYVFRQNHEMGVIVGTYLLVYIAVVFCTLFLGKSRVQRDMVRYAAGYNGMQAALLKGMDIPYAILSEEGQLLWGNDKFLEVIGSKKAARRNIVHTFSELEYSKLPKTEDEKVLHIQFEDHYYRCNLRLVLNQGEMAKESDLKLEQIILGKNVIAMTLYEETELVRLEQVHEEENMVTGLIYIDNYDELIDSIEETRQSLSMALIDRKINSYMQEIDAISKKMESDKFFFVFKQKYLDGMMEKRFSVLEDIRGINLGNEQTATISIGIGVGKGNFAERYERARKAMDLAQGRGGDQAVIKNEDGEEFFGGKRVQIDRNTRVKARVKAHVLKELIEGKERVVVMGHSMGDVDSFGACVGIYRIAKTLNRKANIVLDEVTASLRPVRERFNGGNYEADMIIDGEQAKEIVDEDTLLVIVDVNRGSYTECPELIDLAQSVVVIDHHRQAGDAIGKAVLFYIEPYASSACEMVAEISQYIGNGVRLQAVEAEAMYAGIMIDTNYFSNKTGVRTFEAMAYLKRNGADAVRIRKMFREDLEEYKIKAAAVQNTELYLKEYAISVSVPQDVESPTVMGAKIANALLDINGVKASFVLTKYNGKIYISARSIDEMNVQMMMERLGGGGHANVAGAQLENIDVEDAKTAVKNAIDQMIAEGEAS